MLSSTRRFGLGQSGNTMKVVELNNTQLLLMSLELYEKLFEMFGELQFNSALNVLDPLVNYEILNPQEYIDVPAENEAIHRMLSIEEIVNTISQPDDTDNSDNDGPEFPKISISLALSSIHNISLFLQQEDPSLSTQNRLTILRKLTRELNSMFIERKTQKTLDDYVKPI